MNYKTEKELFDKLDEIEQWEYALKHKSKIEITIDNDNTSFYFLDEDNDDDCTNFYFKSWCGNSKGTCVLLTLLGFNFERA